jgi:hypothetical protein
MEGLKMQTLIYFDTSDKSLEVLATGEQEIAKFVENRIANYPDDPFSMQDVPIVQKGETFYGCAETGYILLEI